MDQYLFNADRFTDAVRHELWLLERDALNCKDPAALMKRLDDISQYIIQFRSKINQEASL